MANPSISLPEELMEEVDDTRHSTTNRSQWVREAIRARLAAEKAGEWDERFEEGGDDTARQADA